MRRDKRRGTIGFDLAEDTHLLARSMYGPPAFIAPPSVEVSASEPSRHIPTDSMDTSNKPNQAQQQGKGRMRILFPNENTTGINLLWAICYILVVFYSILINLGPVALTWIIPKDEWCGLDETSSSPRGSWANSGDAGRRLLSGDDSIREASAVASSNPYENPDYSMDPCRYLRVPALFFFTLEECDMSRRLLCSVLLGGLIGFERRSADRPAGIRTMGLVSLGACSFTISSMMAFKSSTMGWDASRVTAALPSGVGFLGGALIWKGTVSVNDEELHQVHGLTTAASLWLSAAVGVGAGGALYLVTTYVVIMVLMILRYAPKLYSLNHHEEDEEENEQDDGDEGPVEEKLEPSQPTCRSSKMDSTIDPTESGGDDDRQADQIETKRRPGDEKMALLRARSVRNLVPTFAE